MPPTRSLRALLLLALVSGPFRTSAQERRFPYEVGRRDVVFFPAAVGVSLLGELVAADRAPLASAEISSLSPDDINAFDRVAARSWSESWGMVSDRTRDALLGSAVLVSFAPLARDGRWREAWTLGVMFTEAALLVQGVTLTAKELAGRRRPWAFNTSLSVDERVALMAADPRDARQSFFSGHTSAAFALATLMSTVYVEVHGRSSTSDALWVTSLSVAALTGFARVKAGMHYPSDVLVGAAVGAAVGRLVPSLHRVEGAPLAVVSAAPWGLIVRMPWSPGR